MNSHHRNLMHVKRWAVVRTNRNQTVAEHSWATALYTSMLVDVMEWLTPEGKLGIIRQALVHDIEESLTSDIPGNVKRDIIREYPVNLIRRNEADQVGIDATYLHPVIKVASLMDEVLFLLDEVGRGNRALKAQLNSSTIRLYEEVGKLEFKDKIEDVIQEVMNNEMNLLGLEAIDLI